MKNKTCRLSFSSTYLFLQAWQFLTAAFSSEFITKPNKHKSIDMQTNLLQQITLSSGKGISDSCCFLSQSFYCIS
jgi:hypothetical protein